jgi:phosphate transport system substrate-binding protein
VNRSLAVCVLAGLALAVSACRSAPAGLQVAGSTSVQPVAEVLAEAFTRAGGDRVSIQGGGSTAGIQAVLSGVAAIGAISRDLTRDESAQGLVAHTIGYDVLTVVVHPDNPVSTLTRSQLRDIFSGRLVHWGQAGGRTIHLVTREAGSGSREAFRTLVGPISPHAIVQNSSGAIRVAVMDDPQAIGYVSLGVARMGRLKVLTVDGAAPGRPDYPLIRSLSLVTRGEPGGEAAAFIRFARSPAGQELIREEGLVPLRDVKPPSRR